MKKILLILICLIVIFFTGCSNYTVMPMSDYSINDTANMDNLNIKLIKASWTENKELELVFEIENKRKDTITVVPDEYFKLYDINMVQIPNTYAGGSTIIKKNEKSTVTLCYKVSEKKLYEIYFYSGMIDNNIKFTITDNDISNL